MKLTYFGYSIKRVSDNSRFLMDIRPFLNAFCDVDNVQYKNTFTHAGEKVFFLRVANNLFLFLATKSNEIIKKIRATDLSVSEIYDLLSAGEMIGFASYVYIERSFLGFASTVHAPRIKSFSVFVNDIFSSVGVNNYSFEVNPLLTQSTRADALTMPFIGRTSIQVNKENSFYDDLRGLLGGSVEEFADVDSFEIVMKPRIKKNIKDAAEKLISRVPDGGLDKMLVRAKEEVQGQLIDLYLAGKGIVCDPINTHEEVSIYEEVASRVASNEILAEKVDEHENNDSFTQMDIDDISSLHDASSWPSRISDL